MGKRVSKRSYRKRRYVKRRWSWRYRLNRWAKRHFKKNWKSKLNKWASKKWGKAWKVKMYRWAMKKWRRVSKRSYRKRRYVKRSIVRRGGRHVAKRIKKKVTHIKIIIRVPHKLKKMMAKKINKKY